MDFFGVDFSHKILEKLFELPTTIICSFNINQKCRKLQLAKVPTRLNGYLSQLPSLCITQQYNKIIVTVIVMLWYEEILVLWLRNNILNPKVVLVRSNLTTSDMSREFKF